MFGPALYTGVGENVVEVQSGIAVRSELGWRVGKWRQRLLPAEPARLKVR